MERQAAQEAILKTKNLPVGMEQFSASEKNQWDLITEDIDSSDYYVLIIGRKYGSEVPGEGISWTQKEFRYAIEKGIPVLAFIKDVKAKTGKDKMETVAGKKEKLEKFIKEVESHSTVDYWKTKDDIKFEVAVALQKAINDCPRPGWVRSTSTKPRKPYEDTYEEKVLKFLAKNGESSSSSVAKVLNVSPAHANMLLRSLLEEGKIQQTGKRRNVKWQIYRK